GEWYGGVASSAAYGIGVAIFFFQAEDGIRDWSVTGVQTCALPIFMTVTVHTVKSIREARGGTRHRAASATSSDAFRDCRANVSEIGRASCRERVEISGVGVSLKKKKKTEKGAGTGEEKTRAG